MNGCFFTQVQACDVILPASHFSEFLTFCWLQELLVLEEQIGIVGTGLSEEDIQNSLKTRTFSSLATCLNQKKAATVEQQSNFCVICQVVIFLLRHLIMKMLGLYILWSTRHIPKSLYV